MEVRVLTQQVNQLTRHFSEMQQSAAMMADAYSRLGPNFSATMVTSGPGATNLLTGIACSWFDSIPSIHITGQVNSYEKQGAQTKKVLFAKSADVRRRIEELLEVRLLRDELGLNHLDID